jgi:hypothetical protein
VLKQIADDAGKPYTDLGEILTEHSGEKATLETSTAFWDKVSEYGCGQVLEGNTRAK